MLYLLPELKSYYYCCFTFPLQTPLGHQTVSVYRIYVIFEQTFKTRELFKELDYIQNVNVVIIL
jgi:hypothetical protein